MRFTNTVSAALGLAVCAAAAPQLMNPTPSKLQYRSGGDVAERDAQATENSAILEELPAILEAFGVNPGPENCPLGGRGIVARSNVDVPAILSQLPALVDALAALKNPEQPEQVLPEPQQPEPQQPEPQQPEPQQPEPQQPEVVAPPPFANSTANADSRAAFSVHAPRQATVIASQDMPMILSQLPAAIQAIQCQAAAAAAGVSMNGTVVPSSVADMAAGPLAMLPNVIVQVQQRHGVAKN